MQVSLEVLEGAEIESAPMVGHGWVAKLVRLSTNIAVEIKCRNL